MCAGNQAVSREEELLKQGANMLRQRLGRNHAEDIEGTVCPYTRGQIKQKEINVLEETMESPQRGF